MQDVILENGKNKVESLLPSIDREWMSPVDVNRDYGWSTSTLAKWRMNRVNLKFYKVSSKYIRYKRSDIIEFLEQHIVDTVA